MELNYMKRNIIISLSVLGFLIIAIYSVLFIFFYGKGWLKSPNKMTLNIPGVKMEYGINPLDTLEKMKIKYSFEEFFKACRQNNIQVVKLMLDAGMAVDITDKDTGKSALMISCENKNIDLVQLLISRNASINSSDNEGNTALMYAVNSRSEEVVKLLIERGGDVNIANNNDETPLILASKLNDVSISKLVMNKSSISNQNVKGLHFLPVVFASKINEIKRVNFNKSDYYGLTPLMIAIVNCNKGIFDSLITQGADINSENPITGETPLMYCLKKVDNTHQYQVHMDMFKTLINKGADIKKVNDYEMNGLMYAIGNQALPDDYFDYVLDIYKNNLEVMDRDGDPAIIWAILYGNNGKLKKIIDAGANVNAALKSNVSPLFYATKKIDSYYDSISTLIDNGADIRIKDKKGRTILMYIAIQGGNKGVSLLKMLIDNGIDVNAVDNNQRTALIYAICFGHQEIINELILNHADIHKADSSLQTTLEYASNAMQHNPNNANYASIYKLLKQIIDTENRIRDRNDTIRTKRVFETAKTDALSFDSIKRDLEVKITYKYIDLMNNLKKDYENKKISFDEFDRYRNRLQIQKSRELEDINKKVIEIKQK